MTERYFYSPKNKGFYLESGRDLFESSPLGWPEDAVEVSTSDYTALFVGQANGKHIVPGENGYPILIDPPEPTREQLIATAEAEKNALLTEASNVISIWKTKLLMGRALTDEELKNLNLWVDYIDEVEATDTSTAPDISWPAIPV